MNGKRIYMQEVATRDGFQIEQQFIPTDDKIALIDALSQAGYAKIEVTSFTSPSAIPALRDADELMARIARVPGVVYTVLVPNARGAERAMAARADEFNLVMSVSETHNIANLRMTREQSYQGLKSVIDAARGTEVAINVSLSTSFGCPMEGPVAHTEVLAWADRFAQLDVRGVTLCDTTGMADPRAAYELTHAFKARFPQLELTLHFHNTRGMGGANVLTAIEAGANRFDASLGGLGGCPYAPGATGNICTEDTAHMLDAMGYDTGLMLDRVIAAARQLPALIGHDIPGQVAKAGLIAERHAPPADFAAIRERALAREAQ
ncbi:MAG: hydroxymethylglutaryl-CoA lyase [Betaproteobacteria bacterium]|nr:hydroxymethylglutaryl-CoA lyase [Betaproteobacteria bacterium]